MADKPKHKSPYTADRGMPGAFEGETVNDLRFYFDDAAPNGSLLIDDVEIVQ